MQNMNYEVLLNNVLMVVSDDYESFTYVRESLKKICSEAKYRTDERLEGALRKLNADGLVDTFRLSPQPPYSTQINFDDLPLPELWFYASPRGRELVRGLGEGEFNER